MMIDVFNHFMPKAYLDRLGDLIPGHPVLTAFPRLKTLWDVDARRALMDEFGGTQHVLSLANPPPELIGPPDKTPELVRMANDALAEICRKHPDHFPTFIASLPMNNVEASVKEADRAVKELGARGVQVFTNVAGEPLSAPKFRPVFQRMAAHDLAVWVHPMRTAQFSDYAEREGIAERNLVQLRLALRDHGLHDAADLFGDFRRAAGSQDRQPSHGRHDPVLLRQD